MAILFFVVAAALTHVWIPNGYFEYQDGLPAGPASVLLARNLALLATAVALLLPAAALRRASKRVNRKRTQVHRAQRAAEKTAEIRDGQ
jgi:hypothetical protein